MPHISREIYSWGMTKTVIQKKKTRESISQKSKNAMRIQEQGTKTGNCSLQNLVGGVFLAIGLAPMKRICLHQKHANRSME